MVEARKEEAAAAKSAAKEGMAEGFRGIEGEEMEDKREKMAAEMTNWEKVVALVRANFG